MSLFEIFSPGEKFRREQREFDKVRVHTDAEGGKDFARRFGVDLKGGKVVIPAREIDGGVAPDLDDEAVPDGHCGP